MIWRVSVKASDLLMNLNRVWPDVLCTRTHTHTHTLAQKQTHGVLYDRTLTHTRTPAHVCAWYIITLPVRNPHHTVHVQIVGGP